MSEIERVISFSHYIDLMDDEAMSRMREAVLTSKGHDMAVVNNNSLRRLIARIDVREAALRTTSDEIAALREQVAVAREGFQRINSLTADNELQLIALRDVIERNARDTLAKMDAASVEAA